MKKSLIPSFLKNNDTVAIISTARSIEASVLQSATQQIESWGFKVEWGNNLLNTHHQFAGTAAERLHDLQWALDSPHIKAILFARGGYGTVQLIDKVDFSKFLHRPKWLIGFSDITVLLNHIQTLGVAGLHANMPVLFGHPNAASSNQSIYTLLTGGSFSIELPTHLLNRRGTALGELTGGNLTIVQQMIGTATEVDTNGKILFIEEIDEYLYHIDRMMWHLSRSGKLQHLAALLVGHFTQMRDNPTPYGQDAYQIIWEHVKHFSYPVYFNVSVGHDFPNFALVNGGQYRINNDTLTWEL